MPTRRCSPSVVVHGLRLAGIAAVVVVALDARRFLELRKAESLESAAGSGGRERSGCGVRGVAKAEDPRVARGTTRKKLKAAIILCERVFELSAVA